MRPRRSAGVYLEDIRSAIRRIREYTGAGKKAFFADPMIQDAVIRQLAIIGEAARKLPPGLKARHASVPWRQIVGMRNILIHDYSDTSLDTVWATVKKDLPLLRKMVAAMLREEVARR